MPKLYITGSTGLLGGWLLPLFEQELKQSYQIQTLSRNELSQLNTINMSWSEKDIILNLAAMTNVDSCQQTSKFHKILLKFHKNTAQKLFIFLQIIFMTTNSPAKNLQSS